MMMRLYYSAPTQPSPTMSQGSGRGEKWQRVALCWRPDPHPQARGMGGMDEVSDHPPRPFLIVHEVLLHGFQGDELIEDSMLGPPGNRHQLARADAPSHGCHQWQTGTGVPGAHFVLVLHSVDVEAPELNDWPGRDTGGTRLCLRTIDACHLDEDAGTRGDASTHEVTCLSRHAGDELSRTGSNEGVRILGSIEQEKRITSRNGWIVGVS